MNKRVFIALGPMAWGKAETVEQAVSRMRTQVPRVYVKGPYGYSVYQCHPDTTVGGLGDLSYPRGFAPALVKKVEPKGKAKPKN